MNQEHYETILVLLADKVKEQASEIGYLQLLNDDLNQKLKTAEAERKER